MSRSIASQSASPAGSQAPASVNTQEAGSAAGGVVGQPWWNTAAIYQIYPRSFADLDGNGLGDLRGITSRIPYLQQLGVDAVWLSPFYPSALADGGYDVDDPREVAPEIGSLADFDEMIAGLHEAGIRVMVDIVPNHTSNRHAWFQAALAGGPDAPERALYHFREGRGPAGEEPPNDWRSLFGGPIWERVEDLAPDGTPLTGPDSLDPATGLPRPYQWYLHIFAPEQPDLNWEHPQVADDALDTLRFWADRGVDGFRVDVAHGLAKDMAHVSRPFAEIPYWPLPADGSHSLFDRDELVEIYGPWRELLESYDPPRFAVAEAMVAPPRRARYAEALGQAFNFQMQNADYTAESYLWAIDAGLEDARQLGSTTWVLGNHDTFRVASRYGFDPELEVEEPQTDGDEAHDGGAEADGVPAGKQMRLARLWVLGDGETIPQDPALGLARARAAALLTMALPGSLYIYQGDELGLPEVADLPDEVLQDPVAKRNRSVEKGRDGCRVPLPWVRTGSSFGFAPDDAEAPHLPQPLVWGEYSVEAEEADPDSTLQMYRRALELRGQFWAEAGKLEWIRRDEGVLAFARPLGEPGAGESGASGPEVSVAGDAAPATGTVAAAGGPSAEGKRLECWLTFDESAELPEGGLLLASAPLTADRTLPPNAAAWLLR